MDTSITFRLPKKQREKLRRHARARNKTESDILRGLLKRDWNPNRRDGKSLT